MYKLFYVALFFCAVLLYSCSKKTAPAKDTVKATALIKPCYRCHGASLQGNVKTPALAGTKLSKDDIIGIVKNGRGKMPAYGGEYNAVELAALADYIIAFGK